MCRGASRKTKSAGHSAPFLRQDEQNDGRLEGLHLPIAIP
jgi:hypothetical protein